mmetsp:Transcript_24308/g.31393  ORF Transcript_24308/g.31393 Transcript_24308/m.31393 type:complete len:300 (-) Transcript_24308:216-1115(-)
MANRKEAIHLVGHSRVLGALEARASSLLNNSKWEGTSHHMASSKEVLKGLAPCISPKARAACSSPLSPNSSSLTSSKGNPNNSSTANNSRNSNSRSSNSHHNSSSHNSNRQQRHLVRMMTCQKGGKRCQTQRRASPTFGTKSPTRSPGPSRRNPSLLPPSNNRRPHRTCSNLLIPAAHKCTASRANSKVCNSNTDNSSHRSSNMVRGCPSKEECRTSKPTKHTEHQIKPLWKDNKAIGRAFSKIEVEGWGLEIIADSFSKLWIFYCSILALNMPDFYSPIYGDFHDALGYTWGFVKMYD